MMSEKLCERARSGPEVGQMMANENAGNGAGQEEACGAQRVARQGYESGAGGRGPLLLSGYSGGEPYYLYADGTAPAKSKDPRLQPARSYGMVEWRGALARSVRHCMLHCMPRRAMGSWVFVGKLTAVELPSARSSHEHLRCHRHARLVVRSQACLARCTPRGTEERGQ